MDQRGGVNELDRDAALQCTLAVVADEMDQQRSQALAARVDGLAGDGADEPRMAAHRGLETILELPEERLRIAEKRLRGHAASAT